MEGLVNLQCHMLASNMKCHMLDGLSYIQNIITEEEEQYLLDSINQQPWDDTLKRKTQQYGFKYNYETRTIVRTIDIPQWLSGIRDEVFPEANQVIVNHYLPGQGISAHTDDKKFGDKIVIISLKSGCYMEFGDGSRQYLHPRSCLTMEGDMRWKTTHRIESRKRDKVDNKWICRKERISLTFRTYDI